MEFIPERLISGQNLIQHLGKIVQIKAGDDDADEFRLSVCQNTGDLILFIIQFDKRIRDNRLIPWYGTRFSTVRESGLLKYLEIVVLEKCVYSAISLKVTFFFCAMMNLFLYKSFFRYQYTKKQDKEQ